MNDVELDLVEGWVEPELAEEFPELSLVHAQVDVRPKRSVAAIWTTPHSVTPQTAVAITSAITFIIRCLNSGRLCMIHSFVSPALREPARRR